MIVSVTGGMVMTDPKIVPATAQSQLVKRQIADAEHHIRKPASASEQKD